MPKTVTFSEFKRATGYRGLIPDGYGVIREPKGSYEMTVFEARDLYNHIMILECISRIDNSG